MALCFSLWNKHSIAIWVCGAEELALQEQESDASAALQKLTAHVAAIHAACGFESRKPVDFLDHKCALESQRSVIMNKK